MKDGLNILTKESPEEKIKRLERELETEKRGRNNDSIFADKEYSIISKAYLELCDGDYCQGDYSVGESDCWFWDDEFKFCKLKKFLGVD